MILLSIVQVVLFVCVIALLVLMRKNLKYAGAAQSKYVSTYAAPADEDRAEEYTADGGTDDDYEEDDAAAYAREYFAEQRPDAAAPVYGYEKSQLTPENGIPGYKISEQAYVYEKEEAPPAAYRQYETTTDSEYAEKYQANDVYDDEPEEEPVQAPDFHHRNSAGGTATRPQRILFDDDDDDDAAPFKVKF